MKTRITKFVLAGCAPALALLFCNCGKNQPAAGGQDWLSLMGRIYTLESLARLDQPGVSLSSSYDRTGGNNDFNNFAANGPPGWVVLADLPGPGCLFRFWFTGATTDQHRVRFFFDNEREARLDLTLAQIGGGMAPFVAPFAGNDNYCWKSHIPMPYARRLVVMAQDGGLSADPNAAKLYYQLCHSPLPGAISFPKQFSAEDMAGFERIRAAWMGEISGPAQGLERAEKELTLEPGAAIEAAALSGPGMIRRIVVKPDFSVLPTPEARERFLRDAVLRLNWDGAGMASVAAPLGDFFGSVWRRTKFESACFGMTDDGFFSAFPMPFKESAVLTIENQGALSVPARVGVEWRRMGEWDENLGYFHAAWASSGPDETGKPHCMLQARGAGKYVGCVLGSWSFDNTFWLLEGDDYMFVDSEPQPSWRGTGLEDYFDGGWYYQNVLALPLHGLTQKLFFRTVQYRIHLADPVKFESALDMFFERGPDHNSRGLMDSTAFYYLAAPAASVSLLGDAESRKAPEDTWDKINLMMELLNYERFSDYNGALEHIESFQARYPKAHFAPILRLRAIAYRERLDGFEAAKPLYEKFLEEEAFEPADPEKLTAAEQAGLAALDQAKLLLWFHEKPDRALLGLYSNMPASAFLGGRQVAGANSPDTLIVAALELGSGPDVLALRMGWRPYPNWVQACLRTHRGNFVTSPDCRHAYEPQGRWMLADYDDSAWKKVGGTGVKGPPEEPYVWLNPNAFVDMQSKAIGLRPTVDFVDKENGAVAIRVPVAAPGQ